MNTKIFLSLFLSLASIASLQAMQRGLGTQAITPKEYVSNIPPVSRWSQMNTMGGDGNLYRHGFRAQTSSGGIVYIRQGNTATGYEGEYYPTGSGAAKFLTPELAAELAQKASGLPK